MANHMDEINLVQELRSKAEKTDIKLYLKSNLGGYTKKSVEEYLDMLRKQQQAMAETFSTNQQVLFDEKESLKKSNEALKIRISQIESEYKNLSEALRGYQMGEDEISAVDVVALKSNITALEEELNKSGIEKSQLENKIHQQDVLVEEVSLKLEQSIQEKMAIKEMLNAEMLESKKQRGIVAKLSGTIEEKDEEIKFLNSRLTEGKLAELMEKISHLTNEIMAQTQIMEKCNLENKLKTKSVETLSGENETLKQQILNLSKEIEELSKQKDKLRYANRALTEQLEEEYKKSILMIKEKSEIITEQLISDKKLDDANSKNAMLQLQLQKYMNVVEREDVYKKFDQVEELIADVSEV